MSLPLVTKKKVNNWFLIACDQGKINDVKYWLTSPNIDIHADINAYNSKGLAYACNHGHLEVVKYLTASPELNKHINLHANNDEAFISAYGKQRDEILHYLIFNLNLQRTENIDVYMKRFPNEKINDWFNARDLHNQLDNELTNNTAIIKRNKL